MFTSSYISIKMVTKILCYFNNSFRCLTLRIHKILLIEVTLKIPNGLFQIFEHQEISTLISKLHHALNTNYAML